MFTASRGGFLPPARKGFLDSVASGRVVAIIDGELPPDDPLPDHEISEALNRGVMVYGAASVGAMRASNLAGQGMRGIGWVYDQYASGKVTSADEIAVT